MTSLNDFKRIRKIGQGAFGTAWMVEAKSDNMKYVIKEMGSYKMSERERLDARKEILLLSKMNHQNIVTYLNSFEEEGKFHILMEYCEGGDLASRLKSQNGIYLKEDQILEFFVQICLAVKHIHDQKILHRDIKPQNIFLTRNNTVKLGDFGIAKLMNSTTALTKTTVGTPFYFSPEICEGRPYNNKSDIWSLGCVLYEMCTLKYAFSAQEMAILAMQIKNVNYKPLAPNFSSPLRVLIDNIFQRRPDERPNINSILRKPFIMKRLDKYFPPNNTPKQPAPTRAPKRPSTANVSGRVSNSAHNNQKRDRLLNHSPYANQQNKYASNKKPAAKISKVEDKPLVVKQNDILIRQKVNILNNARECGWKNLLSSDDSKSDNSEVKAVNQSPTPNGPFPAKQNINVPPNEGMYEHFHLELDRIRKLQEIRENEGQALMMRMQHLNYAGKNDNQNQAGAYLKIDQIRQMEEKQRHQQLNNLQQQLGVNAAERDKLAQEFRDCKQRALINKYRNGQGVAMALGGLNRFGDQFKLVKDSPRSPAEETALRLNQVRQQNFDVRRGQNIGDYVVKVEEDEKVFKPDILEDLQRKVKQRTEELRQQLEKKRQMGYKFEKRVIEETPNIIEEGSNIPGNVILFPKKNDLQINTPIKVHLNPLPSIEQIGISVLLDEMKPSGDEANLGGKEIQDDPSLSVVLKQLDEPLPSRPSTAASSSDLSEIRKMKDNILKRLNAKKENLFEKKEECDVNKIPQTPRKSWLINAEDNIVYREEILIDTIGGGSTIADASIISHDNEADRDCKNYAMENSIDESEKSRLRWQKQGKALPNIILKEETMHLTISDDNNFDDIDGSTITLEEPSKYVDLPSIESDEVTSEIQLEPNDNKISEQFCLNTIVEEIPEITITDGHHAISSLPTVQAWNKSDDVPAVKAGNEQTVKDRTPSPSSSSEDDEIELSLQLQELLEKSNVQITDGINFRRRKSSEFSDSKDLQKAKDFDDDTKPPNFGSLKDLVCRDRLRIRLVKSDSEILSKSSNYWSASESTDEGEDFGDEELDKSENIFQKMEKIRDKLEREIGMDPLIDAMEFVKESYTLSGDELAEKLKEIVGADEAVNDILHLVVLEEQYNNIE